MDYGRTRRLSLPKHFQVIDLSSDTSTRPSPAMREAMARAEVGDEQRGEDPTTRELERRMAELCGFEAATFLVSATMANAIALQLHCAAGDEILAAENSHIVADEGGGSAALARAVVRTIPTWNGIFEASAVRARMRTESPRSPRTRLVTVENTTNMGGGRPWPRAQLQEVVEVSKKLGLALHLDGSRLFNAACALQRPVSDLTPGFDTATVCLSKGLGCPVGAVLLSSRAEAARAARIKQMMGGAMRQSGVLAAAGLYALEHNLERLREDHALAEYLALRLGEHPGVIVESVPVRTNMVFFEQSGPQAASFDERLIEQGVRVARVGPQRFRAVTHLDVSRLDVDRAVSVIASILKA